VCILSTELSRQPFFFFFFFFFFFPSEGERREGSGCCEPGIGDWGLSIGGGGDCETSAPSTEGRGWAPSWTSIRQEGEGVRTWFGWTQAYLVELYSNLQAMGAAGGGSVEMRHVRLQVHGGGCKTFASVQSRAEQSRVAHHPGAFRCPTTTDRRPTADEPPTAREKRAIAAHTAPPCAPPDCVSAASLSRAWTLEDDVRRYLAARPLRSA